MSERFLLIPDYQVFETAFLDRTGKRDLNAYKSKIVFATFIQILLGKKLFHELQKHFKIRSRQQMHTRIAALLKEGLITKNVAAEVIEGSKDKKKAVYMINSTKFLRLFNISSVKGEVELLEFPIVVMLAVAELLPKLKQQGIVVSDLNEFIATCKIILIVFGVLGKDYFLSELKKNKKVGNYKYHKTEAQLITEVINDNFTRLKREMEKEMAKKEKTLK